MRAGELQRLAQRKGKTETVHEAEGERRQPAAVQAAAQDVGQRHPDDGGGNQGLDEGREPQPLRAPAESGGEQRERVRHGEGGGQHHQRAPPPQRDHQAREEQQVVAALQDVPNAGLHETPRGLVPTRVEVHEARVAMQLEGAFAARRGHKAQGHCHAQAQARKTRPHREARLRRGDGHLQLHVEQLLVPVQLLGLGDARRGQVGHGLPVVGERAVGGERDARLYEARPGQRQRTFVELEVVEQPGRCRLAQRGLGARQVDEATRPQGHIDLAQRGHRHAH